MSVEVYADNKYVAQRVHEICESIIHLCRLYGVVMDGRRVPADVLFFYKTLPLRTGAQGRVCHACDE